MAIERTLAIIKPDAVGRGLTGEILSRIHAAKFHIIVIKTRRLTKKEAEGFYAVHRERPFFEELTAFMSTSKAVVMVLEAENAIAKWALLTPQKPRPVLSAEISGPASNTIARTVPTRRKPPPSKSAISSPARS
jgi:nucleoside diphosphate kinase